MEKELKRQIEKIIGAMECPKDFKCCESDFANVCKAKDIGIESFLECLEENPQMQMCKFSFPFGNAYFCKCPLRVYIAETLKK